MWAGNDFIRYYDELIIATLTMGYVTSNLMAFLYGVGLAAVQRCMNGEVFNIVEAFLDMDDASYNLYMTERDG